MSNRLTITVTGDASDFLERSGSNEKGPWSLRQQTVYANIGKKFPLPFPLNLAKDQTPYPEGEYELDAASFSLDRDGRFALDRYNTKLIPVRQAGVQGIAKTA